MCFKATTASTILFRWSVGGLVGTLLVAVSSPWFVRSYLPRHIDEIRDVAVLQSGTTYRWRSEGYADTWIGPHGMPGIADAKFFSDRDDESTLRVALWGDSQAEGMGVADRFKIFAQAEQLADRSAVNLSVLPLARSGDDARSWLHQLPAAERRLGVDIHMILVVDLPDFTIAAERFQAEPLDASQQRIVEQIPAFALRAVRNLLTSHEGDAPRRLRFAIGPAAIAPPQFDQSNEALDVAAAGAAKADVVSVIADATAAIRAVTTRPVHVIYAPPIPVIMGGRRIERDDNEAILASLITALGDAEINWIDLRPAMIAAARRGDWPRGFHNGEIGNGHLNSLGNRIVARSIVAAVTETTREN